ncbi:hypothetical protein N566_18980 [Streptomycetaceae bacterium MP113-05]|nr:hypothetical protein N566_18980 [Streptomycetaceae bacterium MP113-05]
MTATPPSRTSRAPRRALTAALLVGPLGATLVLVAAGQVWSETTTSFAQGTVPVSATGGDVSGLPSAFALAGLAALVAVFAVRRAVRVAVAGLLALSGAGTVVTAATGAGDHDALVEQAARTSGLTQGAIDAVHVTAWPWISTVGGAMLLLAGLLAVIHGRRWPSMAGTGRYERGTRPARRDSAPPPVEPDRPEDLWKALDRGEDPTRGTS